MITYKLTKNSFGIVGAVSMMLDNVQIISIPFAPDNTDYQVYLKWVSEGNTPEPADE